MTLDGKILRGLFEPERLKPANIRIKSRKCPKSCATKSNNKCWTLSLNTQNILEKGPILTFYFILNFIIQIYL